MDRRSTASAHSPVRDRLDAIADQALRVASPGEEAANRVASRQRRVIHAWQLERCGFGRRAAATRVRLGAWQRPFPRVYVVGSEPLADPSRLIAAALQAAPFGAVTASSAAFAYRVVDRLPETVHVAMVDRRNASNRKGLRVHRPRGLGWDEVRFERGVRVVSPARMLLALATEIDPDRLEAIVALTLRRGLLSRSALENAMTVSPRCPGLPALRRAAVNPVVTRSGNERAMRQLVRRGELPHPLFNIEVEGKELDVYWPEAKLGNEVDDFSTHGSLAAFEDDRRLDVDMEASDIRLLRFTGTRIRRAPEAVVARVAAVLALRLGGLPSFRRRR